MLNLFGHRAAIRCCIALLAIALLLPNKGVACPFCPSMPESLCDEIELSDVAVIAKLVRASKPDAESGEALEAEFQIAEILASRGPSPVQAGTKLRAFYLGDAKAGQAMLLLGAELPNIVWTSPTPLSDRAVQHLRTIVKLPKTPVRLQHFLPLLNDSDPLIARDAFAEFAKAPYADVQQLKSMMNADQLLAWVQQPDRPTDRRRLFLTMLGICGGPKHAPALERMVRAKDEDGMDALLACYITLQGEKALSLVNEMYLGNRTAEPAHVFAAVAAVRFHGTEGGVISRKAAVQSLRLVLRRPELADLVIPDLARWEDWAVMEQVVSLFKTANEESEWVKGPVVNYLRACPLPAAKQQLQELAKLDPAAVANASLFGPAKGNSEQRAATNAAELEGT